MHKIFIGFQLDCFPNFINFIGCALAEDGECLASHCSSDEIFSKHDMGLTSDCKHDRYDKKYSDGYELIDVNEISKSFLENPDFAKAVELNKSYKYN